MLRCLTCVPLPFPRCVLAAVPEAKVWEEEFDLNSVRLCFQASFTLSTGEVFQLSPVVSQPIYDNSEWFLQPRRDVDFPLPTCRAVLLWPWVRRPCSALHKPFLWTENYFKNTHMHTYTQHILFWLQIMCFYWFRKNERKNGQTFSSLPKMGLNSHSQSPFSFFSFTDTSLLFRGSKHSRTEDLQSQPQLWLLQRRGRDLPAVWQSTKRFVFTLHGGPAPLLETEACREKLGSPLGSAATCTSL